MPIRTTDYANQLHGCGIYGLKDYNAWIGKNVCTRLYTSTAQVWQFVDAAVNMYCPDERPVVQRAPSEPRSCRRRHAQSRA
jgi:hypothetical protein